MQAVTFYSYNPYITLGIHKERGLSVQFDKDCKYITSNPVMIQLLRTYADDTRASYNIIEAGGELEQGELSRLHYEVEDHMIADLEKKEAGLAEKKQRKEAEHELYSMLRGSDKVYR